MISVYLLLDSHRSHRFPQIFYLLKSPQISQIHTDFLPLKVPTRISRIFYSFIFKSHADFADDADFFYFFTFLLFYL